jgi:hypothetical protein
VQSVEDVSAGSRFQQFVSRRCIVSRLRWMTGTPGCWLECWFARDLVIAVAALSINRNRFNDVDLENPEVMQIGVERPGITF